MQLEAFCGDLSGSDYRKLWDQAYAAFAHTNPMHADVFPSVRQMECETVAMVASLLGGAPPNLSA